MLLIVVSWLSGCTAGFGSRPTGEPRYQIVREHLVVRSDFPLARRHRILEDLLALRGDMVRTLRLPASDEPIQIRLYHEPADFLEFLRQRYPQLVERRAVFVESDTQLAVYAAWGDHVAEDLRHEVAHGYLHAVGSNLPLWLDEGLAEYFEVPRGQAGRHAEHLRQLTDLLAAGVWIPDLVRLESLRSTDQMRQADYAEAWAWVHFCLHDSELPGPLLPDHLARLRANPLAPALSTEIGLAPSEAGDRLIRHLERIGQGNSGAAADGSPSGPQSTPQSKPQSTLSTTPQ